MANFVRFVDNVGVSAFGNTDSTGFKTGSLLASASATLNDITFTKGDGTQFTITVDTGSGGGGGSVDTGSLMLTGSVSGNTLTFTKGDGSTFILIVDTGSASTGGIFTQTGSFYATTNDLQITGSLDVSNSITASNISASGDIIADNLYIGKGKIYGNEAYNNYLTFNDSSSLFKIKNETYVKFDGSSAQREVTINEGTNDIDFVVKGASNNPLFKTDSATNQIGMHGIGTPEADLHLGGNLKTNSHITSSGNISSSGHISASSFWATPGVINELTSSYALTASYAFSASVEIIKEISSSHANFADTASLAYTADTASYVLSSSIDGITNYIRVDQTSSMSVATASYVETSQTASYVLNSISSSYSDFALTASYAFSASVEIIKEISSSHANFADTASYALDNVLTASVSNNTITFTKGDGSTFPITVDTGSSPTGGDGIFGQIGSTSIYSTTSSLQISGSTLQSTPLSTATVATQSGTDKYAMVVSESVWHYNANVGVPTSNAWKSGLDGSYFNNFDHNTDISEVLRFIATLLSSSAPDASPNTKYWGSTSTSYSGQSTTSKSSLFDGVLGTSYENARLSQHWTSSAYITYSNTASYREAQTYLLDKGFLQASDRGTFGNDTGTNPFHGSYASRIPSTILQSGQFSSLAFTLTANAAGSSTVYSNINYFGMGTLDGGAAKPYEVIILSSQSYSDNYSNQTPTTSSNNYYTASSVTYSISSFGTTGDGLSLGKISTGNPSIPDAYQDGDFNSVDGPFSGRYYTDKATDNTDISSSGYYQMQDLKAGLKTGSMSVFEYQNGSDSNISFYIPDPYQAGFVPAGALVDITNGAPTATISDVLTRTVFTATSRSLSGAPYMLDVDYTFTYNTQVSKSFDPGYAYSSTPIQVTNPTDQWENIGSTSTSNTSVSMNTSGINTNTANAGVFPAGGDPSSRRNTGIIPHVDDIAFLSSSLTFNLDSNANNITSATWNTSTNYDLTFRTTGRNWKNSSQTNTSATQELYDATLFNQPASSGSMAIYSYAQGYDGGTLQGTTEQFTGEDFRIEIDNDFLSGSYTNGNKFTTSTADYYNLSALDLQVRPGYLVRPGSSRGYWLTDPDPTKDYKYYARAFQTSDALTKTSLTINLGQTLENWDSTSDGVSVAIMFESAQTNIDTGGGALSRPVIYDPSTLSSLGISTNQANDDFMNPFTQNIDIKGNNQIGSGLVGTTYTVPLTDTLNQILNATYRNFIVLVRFKQASAVQSITSITVSYS